MADYTDYITQGAIARGLDPKVALHVVDTEGGRSGKTGDSGTSFGPFQMHVAGTAPGTTVPGLGTEMEQKGLNPRDPYQSIDYALDYAKAHGGFSPDIWHGLRAGEHRWVGEPSGEGGTLHLGRLEKAYGDPTGNALLDYLMASHYPSEDKSTGNGLLDNIMLSNVLGIAQPQQQPLDLKPLQRATPQAQLPQTAPELQPGQQVDVRPLTPPPQPTPPTPAAEQPPAPSPSFATPTTTPPTPAVSQASTGNSLLNTLLHQLSPISSAQAAEPPRPTPLPTRTLTPMSPEERRQFLTAPTRSTGSPLLDNILRTREQSAPAPRVITPQEYAKEKFMTAGGLVPPATTDIEQAQQEQKTAQQPSEPLIGVGPGGELTGRIPEIADVTLPYLAGAAPGGAMSSGIRIPRIGGRLRADAFGGRVEPPILRGEVPRIGQSTAVRPFAESGGPPAVPPRVPGSEVGPAAPPPQGPGMFRDVRATVDEPRPPKGDANESAPVKKMRLEAMRSTQDKLFKSWTRAESYKNKLLKMMQRMPRLTGEQKLQVERYLEWQPGMPPVAIDGEAKAFADKFIKPMRERAAKNYAYLESKGVLESVPPDTLEDLTEGYLHRMRVNRSGEQHPFAPFLGVKGLRRTTSSMQTRKWFVMQDAAGRRHIYRGEPLKPGTPIYDDGAGGITTQAGRDNRKIGEVRRATTEEIEKNTDQRYLHDPGLASMQNMAQLDIARRNFDLLDKEVLPELKDQGLATTDREAARRLGMRETQIPALRGTFFEKRLADAFDDFHRTPSIVHTDVAGVFHWIGDITHAAISALFLNPLGHMRNVASDYALSRGNLWWNPASYAGAVRHTRDAFRDVMRDSPFYHDVMRAGGALMGASNENRLLYQALVNRAHTDMTSLPFMDAVAKSTGIWHTGKQMGQAIWNASQKVMWGFHDMLLLSRVRELMQTKNLSIEEAVRQAERHIADYRVPASVGEGSLKLSQPTARVLSRIMQDRTVTVFGRYHYNKLRAIGNTLGDTYRALTKAGIPMADRIEAIGRMGSLLVWSTILQEGLNYVVQQATGNPYAHVTVPGAAGIPANIYRVAKDLAFKRDMGQAAYDFWMGLASIITPTPFIAEAISQTTNRNFPYSPSPIRGTQLPAWQQLIQSGAHAAGTLLPPLQDLTNWRRALSSSAGISLPDAAAAARAKRPHPQELRSESRRFHREFGF